MSRKHLLFFVGQPADFSFSLNFFFFLKSFVLPMGYFRDKWWFVSTFVPENRRFKEKWLRNDRLVPENDHFRDKWWFAAMFVPEIGGFKDKLDRDEIGECSWQDQSALMQKWRALLPATRICTAICLRLRLQRFNLLNWQFSVLAYLIHLHAVSQHFLCHL